MKYWSCCERKTSDFNAFLGQVGCTKGKHEWSNVSLIFCIYSIQQNDLLQNQKVNTIRQDWFSGTGFIHVNIYCKGAIGEECKFETDGHVLRTVVVHGFGTKVTEKNYNLFGKIAPEDCRVTIGERKIEVMLKQVDNVGWPRLEYEEVTS